jgi:hypothetical protein
MFKHEKQLFHPVAVERPNPQYAALLQEQLGGGNGELKAAMQYLSQSFRIKDQKIKDLFLDMVRQMDMSYSYKPVLLKAVLLFADDKGRVKLSDIVTYFREFYEARRAAGMVVEKANSIYAKGGYTDAQAQRNILSNPFKRFEDMQMLHHTKTLGVIQVDESVWKKLTWEEKQEIERICDEKLEQYYGRFQVAQTEGDLK